MADDPNKLWDQARPIKAPAQTEDLGVLWEKAAPRVQTDYSDAPDGLTSLQKFGAGVGIGVKNMGKSLAELASNIPIHALQSLRPDPRAWAEEKRAEAALMNDRANSYHLGTVPRLVPFLGGTSIDLTPGNVGNFTGEMASTAPIGGLVGGGARFALGKLGLNATSGLAGLLARSVPRLAEGAGQGVILGGPDNRTLGALLGGGFSIGGGAAMDTIGALARGLVTPTPEAAALMSRGVPLSIGQMDPGGALSKMEEAGMHSALGGSAIDAARTAGREGWQGLASRTTSPVGAPGSLADIAGQFDRAYEGIRQTPMPSIYEGVPVGQALREGFSHATTDPDVLTSEATRSTVARWLENQASILDRARQFGVGGRAAPLSDAERSALVGRISALQEQFSQARPELPDTVAGKGSVLARGAPEDSAALLRRLGETLAPPEEEAFTTAEPLLKIRSNIRQAIRQKLKGANPDYDSAALLGNAEEGITNALNDRLGPEGSQALRALDARYRDFKLLEDATRRAGDSENGFTPFQLSAAVRAGTPASAYAQGAGGSLRDLAQLGRAVIENKSPMTGAIKQTLPLGLNHAAGPLMALLNSPAGRRFALGLMAPQRAGVTLGDLLQRALPNRSGAGMFLPGLNAYLAPLEVRER